MAHGWTARGRMARGWMARGWLVRGAPAAGRVATAARTAARALASAGRAAGTGIVLTSDGLVLTNNHVVAGATSISVTSIGTGKDYTATVVGYDRSEDVAVIKLAGASKLPTATLANSSAVRTGDGVVAIGNAN